MRNDVAQSHITGANASAASACGAYDPSQARASRRISSDSAGSSAMRARISAPTIAAQVPIAPRRLSASSAPGVIRLSRSICRRSSAVMASRTRPGWRMVSDASAATGQPQAKLSSVLGFVPAPYGAHYSATKHAVEGFSESLDHETRAFGVRVVLIEPAFTRTAFNRASLTPDAMLKQYDEARAGAGKLVQQAMTTADPPEVVADTVVMAATVTRPKHRYPAGKAAKQVSFARRFVPAGMFDKSLRKQLGLPG